MQTLSEHLRARPPATQSASVYVRWNREDGLFSIELKLELVATIAAEIDRAANRGVEIGGILIGVLPTEANPLLRINELQILPRQTGDQSVFLPDPRAHDQFVLARWQAGNKGRSPIGIFRTHLRGGLPRPSLADRTLLAGEFDTTAYVLLLIEPEHPRTAAFFCGSRGELAEEPSVAPFRFEPEELRALPRMEPDDTSRSAAEAALAAKDVPLPVRRQTTYVAAFILLLAMVAASYAWSDLPRRIPDSFATAADPRLSVSGNRILRISWDRDALSVNSATAAKLTIAEGQSRRDLLISPDELRVGSVEYLRTAAPVRVTLALAVQDVNVNETVIWHR